MRKGARGALECPGGRRYAWYTGGWALAIPMCVGGGGAGWVLPLPHPASCTRPVYPTPVPTCTARQEAGSTLHRAPRTGVSRRSKEILGVNNAQYVQGIARS